MSVISPFFGFYRTADQKSFSAQNGDVLAIVLALLAALITDRTQADVARVQEIAVKIRNGTASESELTEWNTAALKGSYNATDLNRVGKAMQYVADRLNSFGYAVSISPKVDWVEADSPSPPNMALYLSNLAVLRNAFAVMQSTPNAPTDMERLTVGEANNIEKILVDIDFLLAKSAQAWVYSGDVFTGEV